MIGELTIRTSGAAPRRVPIDGRPLVLGTAPDADIPVADPRLSPRHCRLEVVGRQLVVTDLGSAEGTRMDGQRVEQAALDPGQELEMGGTRVTFDLAMATVGPGRTVIQRRPVIVPAGIRATVARGASGPPQPSDPPGPLIQAGPDHDRAPAAPAAREGPAVPERIEGYEILSRLDEGSMGIAYLARSIETGAECVLKTIRFGGRSKDAIFFIREVQMGMKLHHPNIVRVVDFGESGGLLFLAMEYVTGGSLLRRIERQRPLSSAEAIHQLVQLADALDYAGRKKFVHRDIKPANILLTDDGVPKLADFGLAKMVSEVRHAQLTQTGEARGTPVYMPPEVLVSASDADARADIYSLGATYYHALIGRPPFDAKSLSEVLRMVAYVEPESLESRSPDVHPGLAGVIRRMMNKRLDARYQTPAELGEDLRRLAKDLPA